MAEQLRNNAGGTGVFAVTPWQRLDRFLILGSEGGTYYVSERALTLDNAKVVGGLIRQNGLRVVRRTVEVSQAGRAPKNDPALFVLAMCAASDDVATRQAAFDALPLVARTGTHLFHFLTFAQLFRGWGRGLRSAVGQWYNGRSPLSLAQQVTKYAQRDGWTHRDVLRLAHVKPETPAQAAIFKFVVGDLQSSNEGMSVSDDYVQYIAAISQIKQAVAEFGLRDLSIRKVAQTVADLKLPREVLPTELLTQPEIWAALLPHMGLTAVLRNLGNMAKVGVLAPLSLGERLVVEKLGNAAKLRAERVHPLQVLVANKVYGQGHGVRGKGEWAPTAKVLGALDGAFEASFTAVVPSGKSQMLALDVSGSMALGDVAGMEMLTPREATAAMALVTARTEPNYAIMAFGTKFEQLNISARDSFADVLRKTDDLPFTGTDCSLPMVYAKQHCIAVDAFVVYTDNETWAHCQTPAEALQSYREASGRAAKLVVVGTTATEISIANPNDPGMLDVVGFDTAAPAVIADFLREEPSLE